MTRRAAVVERRGVLGVAPAVGEVLWHAAGRGYLIIGFTEAGAVARPGEAFTTALWSRDVAGWCGKGSHKRCAHNAGGAQADGHTTRGADGELHTWRCGCDCHGFAVESPAARVFTFDGRGQGLLFELEVAA